MLMIIQNIKQLKKNQKKSDIFEKCKKYVSCDIETNLKISYNVTEGGMYDIKSERNCWRKFLPL